MFGTTGPTTTGTTIVKTVTFPPHANSPRPLPWILTSLLVVASGMVAASNAEEMRREEGEKNASATAQLVRNAKAPENGLVPFTKSIASLHELKRLLHIPRRSSLILNDDRFLGLPNFAPAVFRRDPRFEIVKEHLKPSPTPTPNQVAFEEETLRYLKSLLRYRRVADVAARDPQLVDLLAKKTKELTVSRESEQFCQDCSSPTLSLLAASHASFSLIEAQETKSLDPTKTTPLLATHPDFLEGLARLTSTIEKASMKSLSPAIALSSHDYGWYVEVGTDVARAMYHLDFSPSSSSSSSSLTTYKESLRSLCKALEAAETRLRSGAAAMDASVARDGGETLVIAFQDILNVDEFKECVRVALYRAYGGCFSSWFGGKRKLTTSAAQNPSLIEPLINEFAASLFNNERIVSLKARKFLVDHGNAILDVFFATGLGYVWGTIRTLVALRGVTSASFPHVPSVSSMFSPTQSGTAGPAPPPVNLARSWRWRTAMHYGARAGMATGGMTVLSMLNAFYFPPNLWIERYEFQVAGIVACVAGLLGATRWMFQRTPYWFFPYLLSESNRLDFDYYHDAAEEEDDEDEGWDGDESSSRGTWTFRWFEGKEGGEEKKDAKEKDGEGVGKGRRRTGGDEASI